MLRIKLARKGRRNRAFFRIIVSERSKDPFGDYLENLGYLDPIRKDLKLKEDRIRYWLSQGAQPSDTVHNILVEHGILKDKKKNVSSLTKKKKQELKELAEKVKDEKEEKNDKKENQTQGEQKDVDSIKENANS